MQTEPVWTRLRYGRICTDCHMNGFPCVYCQKHLGMARCPKCWSQEKTCLECLDIDQAKELYPKLVDRRTVRAWLKQAQVVEERYFYNQNIREMDDRIPIQRQKSRKVRK